MIALDGLLPEFRANIESLMADLGTTEFMFRISFALRSPLEQAKLWRQGRASDTIQAKIDNLDAANCDYLAECLHVVGPQSGPVVTNAIPGLSWHQYGQAVDLVAKDGEKVLTDGDHIAYDLLALRAQNLSLTTGKRWGDAGHVQLSKFGKPQYSMQDINQMMKDRFQLTTKGD